MAQVGPPAIGKPLMDGTGDDGEPSKKTKQAPRKRVSQACDRCRARKDKCDGLKPACSTCITNGRQCSYDANVKKRGLPEGYVRGMEKLWGLAIKEVDDVETDILSALGKEDEPLNAWNDEGSSENLVEVWRKSQIFQGLERLLSSLSLEPVGERTKRKRDDSTTCLPKKSGSKEAATPANLELEDHYLDWAQGRLADRGLDNGPQDNVPAPALQQLISENAYESILSPSSRTAQPSVGSPSNNTKEIPELPSETWHLLDVYFSYTHPWLPILEKHDLLRISYQYPQTRTSTPGSGDHAVLWAAIAYAKFQHRAINNIPRALGSVGEVVWTAEKMYAQARRFILNEEGTFEVGHVQALLILTLANMGTDHLKRAWLLIGQAIRIALELQLDHPLEHMLTAKSKSRTKHVFLGCFVLDTIVAARLGRRPHLRANEIDATGFLEEDGLEEWDPWTDCLNVRRSNQGSSRVPASILSTFNRLVQVMMILNEVICVMEGSSSRDSGVKLLETLHTWAQTQPSPSHFQLDSTQQSSTLLPHQYHLHTAFFTTLTASERLCNNRSKTTTQSSKPTRQVAELLNQYSNIFGLLIVPPTYEYYLKTAYEVVNSVQESIDQTHVMLNDWKTKLDYCLDSIEPAWPVFETLRTSISQSSGSNPRRSSQVAFELINGSNHSESPIPPGKTPQSSSYEATSQYSPHPSNSISEGSRKPNGATKVTTPNFPPPSAQGTASFNQSSGHGLPQNPLSIYENAHATFGMRNNQILPAGPSQPPPLRDMTQYSINNQQIPIPSSYQNRLHHSISFGSEDNPGEPVFGDLMRLDATEWAGNWDQSLVNLGFTDQDNSNQAFHTFCAEPDPLHPNNVFQQLVANSNTDSANFFDNAAFGGMASGIGIEMGSFAGFGFPDEHEGIEAGQILQALSSAANDRSEGRGSV